LFMGPSGVGKSKLAKVFAEVAFEGSILRLDVSMTNDIVEAVSTHLQCKPYSLILLEHVEVKHDLVTRLITQAQDEGYIIGSNGIKVDCSNSLFILGTAIENNAESAEATLPPAGQKKISNDLIDRLDCVVNFHALQAKDIQSLAKKYIEKYSEIVKGWDLKGLTYDADVIEFLFWKSSQGPSGARFLQRVVDQIVAELLIDAKFKDNFRKGQTMHLSVKMSNGCKKLEDAHVDLAFK